MRHGTKRTFVLFCALGMLGGWLFGHLAELTGDANGWVRFILGSLFAFLVVLRPKRAREPEALSPAVLTMLGLSGTLLTLLGIVFRVQQFEWLGVLVLFLASVSWALPSRFSRDIQWAAFVLYWIHPLPSQVFGPLQLAMQRLSVLGAEWLFHCANVRAWADQLVLHTGARSFEVPASCSGMRTATTALLCGLGSGILFRFKWRELAVWAGLGLVQVLVLNILRILTMVLLASQNKVEWSDAFLHNATNVFLLVAVVLAQAEPLWWRLRTEKRRKREQEKADGLSRPISTQTFSLPVSWQVALRWLRIASALLILSGAVSFAAFKKRPKHRAAMIDGVLENLISTDAVAAERASRLTTGLDPANSEYRMRRAQVLLRREKYGPALAELEKFPASERGNEYSVMKIWGLIGAGRDQEAKALENRLTDDQKQVPGMAMAMAEFAARRNAPDEVVLNMTRVGARASFMPRLRRLFPYLAHHNRWKTIAACDIPSIPCEDLSQFQVALTTHLALNDYPRATETLRNNAAFWSGEPRFLKPIAVLASRNMQTEWRQAFARSFVNCLDDLSPDDLCDYLDLCFSLRRPDLAWVAYGRLKALDPTHPGVFLVPALFSKQWFVFLKHDLAMPATNPYETVDIGAPNLVPRGFIPMKSFWDQIPLARELADGNHAYIRATLLEECLRELRARERDSRLTYQTEVMYVHALQMAGRTGEALARLDRLETDYPGARLECAALRGRIHEARGDWQQTYEALRPLANEPHSAALLSHLLYIKSLVQLDLGIVAMGTTTRSLAMFPDSPALHTALAGIWDRFGYTEEALFVLTRKSNQPANVLTARLLEASGCFFEAKQMRRVLRLPQAPPPGDETRLTGIPAAELCIAWPSSRPFSDKERDTAIQDLEQRLETDTSPFIKALHGMTLDWYRSAGQKGTSDIQRWEAIGRDPMEKGAAVHKLTMLLGRTGQHEAARKSVSRALVFMPESCILWRLHVALSNGEKTVVEQAAKACPADSGIWLASLIARVRDRTQPYDSVAEMVERAVANKTYSPGTFVRAGDFLLRQDHRRAAEIAARHAMSEGHGMLPAYVLGIRCALVIKDHDWAALCAVKGFEEAPDPVMFSKTIVGLKTSLGMADLDLVRALEDLSARFPEESEWNERLGYAYFKRGDAQRAFRVLIPELKKKGYDVSPGLLIVASESARLIGHKDVSLSILTRAYLQHPDNVHIVNNLAYNLALDETTSAASEKLLPKLLEAPPSPAICDTISMVNHRSGNLEAAEVYRKKALELTGDDYAQWHKRLLGRAEAEFTLGHHTEALRLLDNVRKDPRHAASLEPKLSGLSKRIDWALRDAQKQELHRSQDGRPARP